MIQTGTGHFENIRFTTNGLPVTVTKTIIFPKAFNNPPAILLNIIGVDLSFTLFGLSVGNGISKRYINRYKLISEKASTEGFDVNLEVFPEPLSIYETIGLSSRLIDFSWMAYDEVTIGA